MIPQFNINYAQSIFAARLGQPYCYGGSWSANPADQTDCSGLVGNILEALTRGPATTWGHPVSTESWAYNYGSNSPALPGALGPFSTVAVASLADVPADAAAIIAIHHGGGGADSHTNISVQTAPGVWTVMEDNGDCGVCTTGTGAIAQTDSYWTDYWYLPGDTVTDTLFADVSEFQPPVDDSYPYPVLSIRACDGTYQDQHFAQNYAWMRAALDSGKLVFGIVYTYVRPAEWLDNADTLRAMIDANGGLHPRVALMLDVESGGNPSGNQHDPINALYNDLANYAGSPARVIGYGNLSDLNTMWPGKPLGLRLIVAGYGIDPKYTGMVAHQYTDGSGYGAQAGLPDGAPPFGNCDMNSADGLDPDAFAAACGIDTTGGPLMALTDQQQQDLFNMVSIIFQQVAGTVPGLELLPGSPTPMPSDWPVSLAQVLNGEPK